MVTCRVNQFNNYIVLNLAEYARNLFEKNSTVGTIPPHPTVMQNLASPQVLTSLGLIGAGCLGTLTLTTIVNKILAKHKSKKRNSSSKSSRPLDKQDNSNPSPSFANENSITDDEITQIPSFYIPRLVSYPIRPTAKNAFDLLKGSLRIFLSEYHYVFLFRYLSRYCSGCSFPSLFPAQLRNTNSSLFATWNNWTAC